MAPQTWIEQTTTTLDGILRSQYGVVVDRAVLAHVVDRRCENIARSMQVSVERAQVVLTQDDVNDVAALIALTHLRQSAVA